MKCSPCPELHHNRQQAYPGPWSENKNKSIYNNIPGHYATSKNGYIGKHLPKLQQQKGLFGSQCTVNVTAAISFTRDYGHPDESARENAICEKCEQFPVDSRQSAGCLLSAGVYSRQGRGISFSSIMR